MVRFGAMPRYQHSVQERATGKHIGTRQRGPSTTLVPRYAQDDRGRKLHFVIRHSSFVIHPPAPRNTCINCIVLPLPNIAIYWETSCVIATLTSDADGSDIPSCQPKPRRGQPSRYNDALRTAICRDIEAGVPVSKAFACNGISPRTGFNWTLQRPEFARAVEAARLRYQRRWHPVL